MATCRVCRGVGSYVVLIGKGPDGPRYEIQACYVCDLSGIVIEESVV